jgi:hypothetical protein
MVVTPFRSARTHRRLLLVAFLAVLSTCVGCPVYVEWSAAHMPSREAEERILASGGDTQRESILPIAVQVLIDGYPYQYGPVWVVSLRGPVSDDTFRDVTEFMELRHLDIMDATVAEGSFARVSSLSRLDDLSLCHTNLTDDDLVHLHGLRKLTHLYLVDNPGIILDGVKRLQQHNPWTYIAYYARQHKAGVVPDYTSSQER